MNNQVINSHLRKQAAERTTSGAMAGDESQRHLYMALMFAGCVPFLVGAMAPYFRISNLPLFGDVQSTVAYYALGISSFMAGTFWSLSLSPCTRENAQHGSPMCPRRLMLLSNALMLTPWLAISAIGIGVAFYFSLAVSFAAMMITDFRLNSRRLISSHYLQIRLLVTAIVVSCLVSLAFTAA